MKFRNLPQVITLLALLFSFIPGTASALASPVPAADIFQLPWTQGESWIAMDGFDNGTRRLTSSPHNYQMGGAVDFAPNANMSIGMDTSNFWVTAAAAGTVFETSSCHIKIDHGNGWITEYWHLDNLQVTKGTVVYRNQRMGIISNSKYQKVCLGNEYPGPHLHFVMRPNMKQTAFAGWTINYNALTNKTTFSKDGKTVGSYEPILNLPILQIAWRDSIVWDTLYTGSVDAYRYERWPLELNETTKFTVTTSSVTSGLATVVVLLDSSGNEITRGAGMLTSTHPAGTYFVQIQAQAGNGFYFMSAKKEDLSEPTPTPTPTSTSTTPTATPTSTTPTPSPTSTSTTPTATPTSTTPTPTSTSTTPTATPTSTTPTPTSTSTTPTATPTSTTPTPTSTSTTPTATPTSTTPTPMSTSTTPTATPTSTTPTPTSTSTTPTATPTSTTPTPTSTSTTPTATPTSTTPTPTSTSTTPTATSTSTMPTPTSTSTTPTATPTSTTPTPTPTSTTPTVTPTPTEPYASTVIIPTSIIVGEIVPASVNLNNVPAEGYTSAEFTCTYNPALLEVSNIAVTNLFGSDAAAAINGPQNGSFIVAIAGSNGNRATTNGTAFTFNVRGLQVGQAVVECAARVSKGDGILSDILSIGDSVNIAGSIFTETPTPTPTPTPTFNPTPLSAPVVTGQVLASKPVTINLYNADKLVVVSAVASANGTFILTAPAGSYAITASADGFLGAQGFVTLTAGVTSTMPTVGLAAGDVNNNGVIDQFDAMTIGMGYNTAIPPAADLNNDGTINVLDLELLARNYRKSGAIAWQ